MTFAVILVPIPSFTSYILLVAESLQIKYTVFKKRLLFVCALAPASVLVKIDGKISAKTLKYFANFESLGIY